MTRWWKWQSIESAKEVVRTACDLRQKVINSEELEPKAQSLGEESTLPGMVSDVDLHRAEAFEFIQWLFAHGDMFGQSVCTKAILILVDQDLVFTPRDKEST